MAHRGSSNRTAFVPLQRGRYSSTFSSADDARSALRCPMLHGCLRWPCGLPVRRGASSIAFLMPRTARTAPLASPGHAQRGSSQQRALLRRVSRPGLPRITSEFFGNPAVPRRRPRPND